jgi:hypothetical protein
MEMRAEDRRGYDMKDFIKTLGLITTGLLRGMSVKSLSPVSKMSAFATIAEINIGKSVLSLIGGISITIDFVAAYF